MKIPVPSNAIIQTINYLFIQINFDNFKNWYILNFNFVCSYLNRWNTLTYLCKQREKTYFNTCSLFFGDDKFAVLIDHFHPCLELVNTVEAVFEWTVMKAALYSR